MVVVVVGVAGFLKIILKAILTRLNYSELFKNLIKFSVNLP